MRSFETTYAYGVCRFSIYLASFFHQGKDRFPYHVGYKAVRAHSGNTYYMEIEEGAKGPLFLVRC